MLYPLFTSCFLFQQVGLLSCEFNFVIWLFHGSQCKLLEVTNFIPFQEERSKGNDNISKDDSWVG